jgi:outer membrane protein assembly factor BamD
MSGITVRNTKWLSAAVLLALLAAGCGGKNRPVDLNSSVEPDKVLYERAMQDIKKNRLAVARLTLQTLINTYPDSEYLAKAKLAIADSYYKEGGTAGLAQAVVEYKDFETFFPFLDEAAYAQMQIAMAHYRRMEKPDRDRTYAVAAEEEFQRFLLTYPNHPLAPQAEQHLREVQEVLAEGDFRIARFYFIKGTQRATAAAAARLLELVDRYPLYSQSDRALWMLAGIYERAEHTDLAGRYYSRIVSDYPLSPLVDQAKTQLTALGVPVPQPNPEALARMQKEKEFERERTGMWRRPLGMFKTGPDVSMAARTGKPNLEPPEEPVSAKQAMTPPGGGNMTVGVLPPGGSTEGGSSSAEGTTSTSPDPEAKPSPEKPAADAAAVKDLPQATDKNQKKEEEKKKKEEEKKKKESSSKKKKGLRKIIPW